MVMKSSSSNVQPRDPLTNVICIAKYVTLNLLLLLTFFQAPTIGSSSVTCHGALPGVRYRYTYDTELILNNRDRLEPAGFSVSALVHFENVWQDGESYLVELALDSVQFKPRADVRRDYRFEAGPIITGSWPLVLASIEASTGQVRTLYVGKGHSGHASGHRLEPTQLNLIVSLLNSLRSRFGSTLPPGTTQEGRLLTRRSDSNETSSINSILSPQIADHWEIKSQLASDHDFPELVTGWQNVSIESKIYAHAHSNLFTNFQLKLQSEEKSPTSGKLASAGSLLKAVHKYGQDVAGGQEMVPLGLHFIAEKKPCDPHFCKDLPDFVQEYRNSLAEDQSLAKTSIGIAYLRLLGYLRTNSGKITRKDVVKLLKGYFKSRHQDGNVFITLLDAIAGSRHGESMMAAFQFLDLTKCGEDSADICERYLVGTSISAITTANMGNSYIAEHSLSAEGLLDLFLPLSTASKWSDHRVKHAYGLTLATLLNSYQVFSRNLANSQSASHLYSDALIAQHSSPMFVDVSEDGETQQDGGAKHRGDKIGAGVEKHPNRLGKFSEKVLKYLIHELDSCKDSDCRVVYLHALGNARILSKQGVMHVFKKYAINSSNKRESVAAMKALRECVEFAHSSQTGELTNKLVTRLRQMLIRVVYDSTLETTTRLIASELLAKFIDQDGQIMYELVQNLETFPSELATMIWKRAVVNVRSRIDSASEQPSTTTTSAPSTGAGTSSRAGDWHLQSKVLTGSSASFKYVMGGTGIANASYGVFLELLKGKLPKETSFNVELNSGDVVQDIINVGLFARGLQSFAGGEDTADASENEVSTDEEDSTLAGMNLQVLGNQLRPFVFFRSTSELMGHLWSGAASEPTPVFRANLLIADYQDIRPLISGFLVEQSLKGMLSLDLNGEVQVSLWNRNSHSNVQTMGAMMFQGSQEIFTTDRKTSARKYFSFGAESRLNFITDFDFYNSPYRICIQITQPEFVFRHNTRKYEQIHSDSLHRRIHRRSYRIPAKSYILNRDNSEMCALMNANSD